MHICTNVFIAGTKILPVYIKSNKFLSPCKKNLLHKQKFYRKISEEQKKYRWSNFTIVTLNTYLTTLSLKVHSNLDIVHLRYIIISDTSGGSYWPRDSCLLRIYPIIISKVSIRQRQPLPQWHVSDKSE